MSQTAPRTCVVCVACALLSCAAFAQQQPLLLAPEAPKNGVSVGKKPKFVIRAEGGDAEALRFRIELSRDAFRTIAYTFDQLKEKNGWAYTALEGDVPGAIYMARQPIAGGDYQWRVASWDGLSWLESPTRYRLTIDDVAPAEVDGLEVRRDAKRACVELRWSSVATDKNGKPERVALYHVYRSATRSAVIPIRPFQAGETTDTAYIDCDRQAQLRPMLFYSVVAEDEAGNITGRRY